MHTSNLDAVKAASIPAGAVLTRCPDCGELHGSTVKTWTRKDKNRKGAR